MRAHQTKNEYQLQREDNLLELDQAITRYLKKYERRLRNEARTKHDALFFPLMNDNIIFEVPDGAQFLDEHGVVNYDSTIKALEA